MFTLIILICSIQAGCGGLGLAIVACMWAIILPSFYSAKHYTRRGKNPIDKHGDEVYGTIDWFRQGKL